MSSDEVGLDAAGVDDRGASSPPVLLKWDSAVGSSHGATGVLWRIYGGVDVLRSRPM